LQSMHSNLIGFLPHIQIQVKCKTPQFITQNIYFLIFFVNAIEMASFSGV